MAIRENYRDLPGIATGWALRSALKFDTSEDSRNLTRCRNRSIELRRETVKPDPVSYRICVKERSADGRSRKSSWRN